MTTATQPRVLRDYQTEAVESVVDAWATETRRVGVVAATGLGKSTIIAALAVRAANMGLRVVMVAHRGELLEQMADTVTAVDPARAPVGIVQAQRDDSTAQIVAATVQTLTTAKRREALGRREVILWDECFVAGTLVGGVPIETLRSGDTVTSWSETENRPVPRKVVRTMKSRPSSLVRVTLTDGQTIVCTPGHPFLTDNGWTPAGALSHGVWLHHVRDSEVHSVRGTGGHVRPAPQIQVQDHGEGVLHPGARASLASAAVVGNDEPDEPAIRLATYAGTQPDEGPGSAGEGVPRAQGLRVGTAGTRRERCPGARATAQISAPAGVADRNDRSAERRPSSDVLQPGHHAPVHEGVRGGGREKPRHDSASERGPETGPQTAGPRVASVQVLEPGRDGTYGGLCPGGYVYNLEVDTDHTYTVGNGIVVHNCHHLGAETWHAVFEEMGGYSGAFMCGFTATMTRDSGVALGEVIEKVVFERDLRWAVKHGHLAKPEGLTVELPDLRLDRVGTVAGDYNQGQLAEVMEASTDTVVSAITRYAGQRRPLIFAAGVDAARALTAGLHHAGMSAGCVTGDMDRDERAAVYNAYRSGSLQAMVTVMVLTEGADFPMCDTAVIARPTRSQTLYSQMVGRALRLWPGKTEALVLDLVGVSATMSPVTVTSLLPDQETMRVNLDGEVIEEPEPVEEPAPRVKREGPVEMVPVDLLADDAVVRQALWLRTRGGVPFMTQPDHVVFLWPHGADLYRVGWVNLKGAKQGDWITGPTQADKAVAAAHEHMIDRFGSVPSRAASWRRSQAPSDAQVQFARTLHIDAPESKTRARLSDDISVAVTSNRIDPR